ncbi:hypothetical protein [Aquamicrobium soli]|uniref:7-cyano-7-deazaguanine synthase n=1 Tax=Aquamicrobium soli TaxID=1811518 RepID=A0ABV7K5J0_9HYPH
MPRNFIVCGGVPPPVRRAGAPIFYLDIGERARPGSRIHFELLDIIQPLVDDLPAVLADALEIAAYVYSADRLVRRGNSTQSRMGEAWRRDLHFKIPVRRPDIWQTDEVCSSLTRALGFLSEDDFSFEFVAGRDTSGLQLYLGYSDPAARKIIPDEVLLFSGGLDSLAGAVAGLIGKHKKLILVSHRSATHVAKHQTELVQELRNRTAPRSLDHVSLRVHKGDAEPVEFTQRTRSFLFYTLGMAVARMHDIDTLNVAENGVTTFNIPIAENVLGSRASRTTHPRVLAQFSELFSLILERPAKIVNRNLWHTKYELVTSIAENDCADLIPQSTSCASVRNLSMSGKPCGVCSQCVERRFSILAAGLDGCESPDDYEVDPFIGAHKRRHDVTYAEQYVLRSRRFASISRDAFLAEYGEVFRALPYLPGPPDQNAGAIYDLHRRHGAAAIEVLNKQLREHSDLDGLLDLPPTSLLAMVQSSMSIDFETRDPIKNAPKPSAEAALDRTPVKHHQFMLAVDAKKKRILLSGGASLAGKSYELIVKMVDLRRREIAEELPADDYEFIMTTSLCKELKIEEPSLRRRVYRIRSEIEKQFSASLGYTPDQNDVVESNRWNGYRINPYVILVSPGQIQSSRKMSRKTSVGVTHSIDTH